MPPGPDVERIGIRRATITYRTPIATAHGTLERRDVVLLVVADGDGNVGHGEAAPLDGFTPETVDEAETALRRWADDGTLPEASPTATAAVDAALLDLSARRAGRPACDLLAPGCRTRLPVTALVAGRTVDALAADAARAVADGHPGVKVKVGIGDFADDLERVTAVREAIGDARLRLDANGDWGADDAIAHLGRLADLDVEFVEEPTSGLEPLARVRAASPIPVAVDESAPDAAGVDRALALGAADVVVLKPSALGGPLRSARVARRCIDAGATVVVTSLLEGSTGIRAAAHLAAALDLADPAPGLATAGLLAADPGRPLLPVGGALDLA